MTEQFIGRGWAFPLRTDPTGGIALVAREREIEEAARRAGISAAALRGRID